MFMTAAGTVAPAKILILGAGGCRITIHCHCKKNGSSGGSVDTRPAVKEEVMSLGGKICRSGRRSRCKQLQVGYAVEQNRRIYATPKSKIAESVAKADIVYHYCADPRQKSAHSVLQQK